MKLWNIFKKKKVKTLHKNKFNKGDDVLFNGSRFTICDFVNEIDTTKYILIDFGKIYLYEWIDESELLALKKEFYAIID